MGVQPFLCEKEDSIPIFVYQNGAIRFIIGTDDQVQGAPAMETSELFQRNLDIRSPQFLRNMSCLIPVNIK